MSQLFESLEARRLLSGDAFVSQFDELFGEHMTSGEAAAVMADAGLDDVYVRTSWNAEKYWFQTGGGDVYAVWHGGAVHDPDGDGRFQWNLTNVSDAAGVPSNLRPGTVSATFTPWRAMNIVGLSDDGQIVAYWWSPESGERGFGARGNGWCLTNLSEGTDFGALDDDGRGGARAFSGVTAMRMAGDRGLTIEIIVHGDGSDDRAIVVSFTPGSPGHGGAPWIARAVARDDLRDGNDDLIIVGDFTVAEGEAIKKNIRVIDGTLTVLGTVEGNIRQTGPGSVVVDGGLVKGNVREQGAGGISILSGGVVEGNAIEWGDGDIVVDGSSLLKGNAKEHDLGDIRIESGSRVEGNAIERGAGGIFISGSILKGNALEHDLGDIRIESGSLVEGNAIEHGDGSVIIADSELKGNALESGAGDIRATRARLLGNVIERGDGDVVIVSSFVEGNVLEQDAGSIDISGDSLIKGNVRERGRGGVTIAAAVTVEGNIDEDGVIRLTWG